MSTIGSIIFDLDGVLVNTIEMHYQAWRKVAQSGGRDLTYTEMEALRGVRRDKCLDILFPHSDLTPDKIDEYLHIKHTAYLDSLTQQHPEDVLIPNALNLIISAQDMNLRLGIASSSVNAHRVLAHVGLTSQFDVIADGSQVTRSKPHPDIFLWVAGALGVSPQHAMVFEDSVAGIHGAKQAGMYGIGVANPETQSYADTYYQNLSEIDLNTLFQNLNLTVASHQEKQLTGDNHARN